MKRLFFPAAIAAMSCAVAGLANDLESAAVTEAELRAHIAVLASDDYGGRFPGTPGETLAAQYIAQALSDAGFIGGADADGSWYQPVPLVEMVVGQSEARFSDTAGRAIIAPDVLLRAPSGSAQINGAQVIFVGYGVDSSGQVIADVAGKIALVLGADRPGENPLPAALRREALIAKGAVAIITVSAPGAASFRGFLRSYTNARMQLAGRVSRAQIEGVMANESAQRLMQDSGLSLVDATSAAATNDYAGMTLSGKATLRATTARRDFNSYNVVARLPGRRSGSGTVLVTGHWDHLGSTCRPATAADRICNGAVDNASGIAAMIEIARRVASGTRLDRDVVFVATTAEEQGLLGAYHFASNPVVSLSSIVIALNIDTVAVAPRGAAMAIVGRGATRLTAEVEAVAQAMNRAIDRDDDANAFLRRQDGWALSQAGVPAIMAGGGFSEATYLQAFISGNYHTPADEMTDAVQLGGAADDADLHIALIRHFASTTAHPRTNDQD
ncbi:MAG: M28 family peptidase [Sphingopyxis sp.]